jgi:hypothetical protein
LIMWLFWKIEEKKKKEEKEKKKIKNINLI